MKKNLIKCVIISFVFLCVGSGKPCTQIFGEYLVDFDPKFKELMENIANLLINANPEVLQSKTAPTWKEIDNLEKIYSQILETPLPSNKELTALFGKIKEQSWMFKGEGNEIVLSEEEAKNVKDYKPTERELLILYAKLWNSLADFLPETIKPPQMRLYQSKRNPAELTSDGKLLVDEAEKLFLKVFKTTGYQRFEDFQRAISTAPEIFQRASKLLESEDLEVAMHRPENARWWVLRAGLYNQHVTGSSEGAFNTKKRDVVESFYLGKGYEEYSAIDNEVKPNYGLLRPKMDSGLKAPDVQYGTDVFVFDIDKIRDRLTFAFGGDSLDRFPFTVERGLEQKANWYDEVFIPWKYRSLLTIPLVPELSYNRLGTGDLRQISGMGQASWGSRAHYIEIQIFGGNLTLDLIKAFEFENNPPSEDFLKALRERNIEIRQIMPDKSRKVWEEDLPK